MGRGRRWRKRRRQQEKPALSGPASFRVTAIRVSDDGLSLTGPRYAGYIAEVRRRQNEGIAQDMVTIWWCKRPPLPTYTLGMPRVNTTGELEVLGGERLLGTVRLVDDMLRFFPE